MHVKKVTKKDRYGNQTSFEFEVPKPLDETSITKHMMDKAMEDVPPMMSDMDMAVAIGDPNNHPGETQRKRYSACMVNTWRVRS